MAEVSIDLGAMQALIDDLTASLEDVAGDASTIRGRLSGVMLSTESVDPLAYGAEFWTWLDDRLMDLHRRLALARMIAQSTPGIAGIGVVTFDDQHLSTLSQAEVDALADQAASLMAVSDDDFMTAADVDPALLEILAANAHDPYFAQALAERVSPQELDHYLMRINAYRMYEAPRDGEDALQDFDRRFSDLLNGLGMAYGLASQGTGTLAVPGLTEQWTAYVQEVGPHRTGGVNRLSTVIGRGTFSTDFLIGVTEAVEQVEGDAGSDFWIVPGLYDTVFDPDPALSPGANVADDPMAGLFTALAYNPEALRQLFATGETVNLETADGPVEVNARLWHMIRHRGGTYTGEYTMEQLVAALQAGVMSPPVEGQEAWQPGLAEDLVGLGAALEHEAQVAEDEQGPWWSRWGHAVLDVVGLVPLLGEAADGLNGLWYLAEGNYLDAGLSLGSMIPFGGWFVQGGKWTRRALNAEELAELQRLAEVGDLTRYLPGGRLVDDVADLADPANFQVANFLTPADLRRFSGDRAWLQPLVAGRRFDDYMAPNYPANQVRLDYGDGRYVVLDSYVPGQQIISRKLTQLSEINQSTAFRYIDELVDKYPPGARIQDVDNVSDLGLGGQLLEGQQVLQIPPQVGPIPDEILEYAAENNVRIIDINGVDHTDHLFP